MVNTSLKIFLVVIFILSLQACADVKVPTAEYALTHPLSTKTMVVPGTSKGEVLEKWGEPSDIIDEGYDDRGIKKEAWIYEAWFPNTPIDFRHLSRRKKIYFTGDFVTGHEDIEDEKPL
ncbi:MAG: hypothetical protein KJ957_03495 [Candidatus Omnitrophica bacterium]|nr:hypothetical protein [Candidatus Omnitrophota bacterium]MBU1853091.1 hypothetical protein [Candidatus Omnitrophota bacterium]